MRNLGRIAYANYQLLYLELVTYQSTMSRFKIEIVDQLFLCAICFTTAHGHGISLASCLIAYNEGGAPALFHSGRECPQWLLLVNSLKNKTRNCDFATIQGHRDYQEDRATCNLDINIPLLGKQVVKESKLDVLAIFDGHGGEEASEMANQKFLDYFLLHVVVGAFKKAVLNIDQHDLDPESLRIALSVTDDESLHGILKEALLSAVHDIDREYSLEAFKRKYNAGSTATVVLLLNGEDILVASLGDSPALLCKGSSMTKLIVEELTRNHHPGQEDERARIEGAGGFVRFWGVPRVNGILAISRAIGDVSLKRFGVIAEPEVKGWQHLTTEDRYLVIASDGVFEGLSGEDVCNLIQDADLQEDGTNPCPSTASLSDCIVKTALRKGSMDNLTAIVVPLRQAAHSQPAKDEL